MGEPHARFIESIELTEIDGYSVAGDCSDEAVVMEPSRIPYVVRNLSGFRYERFVDDVENFRCETVGRQNITVFAKSEEFRPDDEGELLGSQGHSFVQPGEPRRRGRECGSSGGFSRQGKRVF